MAKLKTDSRNVSNAGQLRNVGIIPLPQGRCVYESGVERDGLYDLSYRRRIISLVSQPETIELWIDGVLHEYTPDVKYITSDGEIGLREFKHADFVADAAYQAKLDAAKRHYATKGIEFTVMKSDEIRLGHRMDNIRCLRRYYSWPLPESIRRCVLDHLRITAESTLGDLKDLVGVNAYGALYRLVYEQQLGVDLAEGRLCSATRVWEVKP